MKKLIIFLVVFSFTKVAFAEVVFNEVQISPKEGQFIEFYSNEHIDLTGWSIKRKTVSGTEYSLASSARFKDKSISADSYFVLVNEVNYTGGISPDATWPQSYSMASDNGIFLYDNNGNLIDNVGWGKADYCNQTCPPNPIKDLSIQKVNGSWISSSPTPGEANSYTSSISDEDTDTIKEEEEVPEILKISAKIVAKNIVIAGVPFKVDSKITTNRKETYMVGDFLWNFGDGMVRQEKQSKSFDYLYQYPGEYVLNLDYYQSYNIFSLEPDATARMVIKVVPSDVVISSVSDGYVEIENKSKYEVVMSDWSLKSLNKSFVIPKGTTILAGKKIRLSSKITNFDFFDIQNVSLSYPSGEVVSTYPKIYKSNSYQTTSFKQDLGLESNSTKPVVQKIDSGVIDLNDLGASSGSVKSNRGIAYWGLAGIILIGSLAVYFARKPKDEVESSVSAKDISILE